MFPLMYFFFIFFIFFFHSLLKYIVIFFVLALPRRTSPPDEPDVEKAKNQAQARRQLRVSHEPFERIPKRDGLIFFYEWWRSNMQMLLIVGPYSRTGTTLTIVQAGKERYELYIWEHVRQLGYPTSNLLELNTAWGLIGGIKSE